jgi:hypothetical protein
VKIQEIIMNEIEINGVTYVPKDSLAKNTEGLDFCIVRCRNAGVHAGYVESRKDGVLTILDSRRLWRWWSKFTLSGLATAGVLKGKEAECKFSCVLPKLQISEHDVCEVIPCSEEARYSINSIKEHSNE